MDWQSLGCLHRAKLVHRLADYVHHASQRFFAHGHRDGTAEIRGVHAAHHAVRGLHGHRANTAFAQMLLDFQHHINWIRHLKAFAGHTQRLINRRQVSFRKLHVNRGARDLYYFANILSSHSDL